MSGAFVASYVALWLLVAILGVGVYGLYHHFGVLYMNSREGREGQGPPLDEPLSSSELESLDGTRLRVPSHGMATLILFASTTCGPCRSLRDRLVDFTPPTTDLTFVVVCEGRRREVINWSAPLPSWVHVVADRDARVASRYGIAITPYVVGATRDGIVRTKGITNDERTLLGGIDLALGVTEVAQPVAAT